MKAISYVILQRDDEVLLQLRQGTGYMDGHWGSAAAGHIEAGETAIEAALREAIEELGISLDTDELQPLCTLHRAQRPGQKVTAYVDFFFRARRWSGTPTIMERNRAADLRWFKLDQLPQNLIPHERMVLGQDLSRVPAIITM